MIHSTWPNPPSGSRRPGTLLQDATICREETLSPPKPSCQRAVCDIHLERRIQYVSTAHSRLFYSLAVRSVSPLPRPTRQLWPTHSCPSLSISDNRGKRGVCRPRLILRRRWRGISPCTTTRLTGPCILLSLASSYPHNKFDNTPLIRRVI